MSANYDELYSQLREYLERQQPRTEEERDMLIEKYIEHYNQTHLDHRVSYSRSSNRAPAQRQQFSGGAEELVQLAEEAKDPHLAVEYASRALRMDPENISAQIIVAKHNSETPDELLEKLREITGRASVTLKRKGYFKSDTLGRFWYSGESRRYILLLREVVSLLTVCGKLRAAADMCNYMIRLCAEDTVGARYYLMSIYAYLEDENGARELYERFPDSDPLLFLPLAALYYKLDNTEESEKYLLQMRRVNKGTRHFFELLSKGDISEYMSDGRTENRGGPISELIDGYSYYNFLLASIPTFVVWANDMLSGTR